MLGEEVRGTLLVDVLDVLDRQLTGAVPGLGHRLLHPMLRLHVMQSGLGCALWHLQLLRTYTGDNLPAAASTSSSWDLLNLICGISCPAVSM